MTKNVGAKIPGIIGTKTTVYFTESEAAAVRSKCLKEGTSWDRTIRELLYTSQEFLDLLGSVVGKEEEIREQYAKRNPWTTKRVPRVRGYKVIRANRSGGSGDAVDGSGESPQQSYAVRGAIGP